MFPFKRAHITVFLGLAFVFLFVPGKRVWASSPFFIKILSPKGHEVWREGETHKISWLSYGVKHVCVEVAVGGKDKGLIGDDACNMDASKGYFYWTIPRGFITGFGISVAQDVKVLVFDPKKPRLKAISDEFTICGANVSCKGSGVLAGNDTQNRSVPDQGNVSQKTSCRDSRLHFKLR